MQWTSAEAARLVSHTYRGVSAQAGAVERRVNGDQPAHAARQTDVHDALQRHLVQIGRDLYQKWLRCGAFFLYCALAQALEQRFKQRVKPSAILQFAQPWGVGRADVDGEVVAVGVERVERGKIVGGGHVQRCNLRLSQAQAQWNWQWARAL